MGLVLVTERNRAKLLPQILELEANAEYPLGDDWFKIDHGQDYFGFFNRLGNLRYYVWMEGDQVAAVAASILRKVPSTSGVQKSWYLSDLKVHPDFRGNKITGKMLTRGFLPIYARAQRGYAISMNRAGTKQNRVAKLLAHFRWAPLEAKTNLNLWSLDEAQMKQTLPLLERHRGKVHFLSLGGIKDIVLKSTGRPMPLLHAQFGPLAEHTASLDVTKSAVHMFCAPESDALSKDLLARGLTPSATASVIAHRMNQTDWTWILTSDI